LTDDFRRKDVGFHGPGTGIPQLDEFTQDGAPFERFCTQPMCIRQSELDDTGSMSLKYGLPTEVSVLPRALH
jgi:hypothetical protein